MDLWLQNVPQVCVWWCSWIFTYAFLVVNLTNGTAQDSIHCSNIFKKHTTKMHDKVSRPMLTHRRIAQHLIKTTSAFTGVGMTQLVIRLGNFQSTQCSSPQLSAALCSTPLRQLPGDQEGQRGRASSVLGWTLVKSLCLQGMGCTLQGWQSFTVTLCMSGFTSNNAAASSVSFHLHFSKVVTSRG